MNKLDYCVSLRKKGLSKTEIIKEIKAHNFDQSDIEFYLKKSDEIYLNQLLNSKTSHHKKKPNRIFKTIVLIISFLLLIAVFYGYASIGLIGLFIFWSLVKYGSYSR
ncbi:hypothetical protein [uncultured Winogradskyella sp.]|uniref:hypothetical protein n=1 Tax=uncultured Winogradskyella sp. TaxID=395353 RepID=UPI00260C008C|nr:hypothetical protein [uncultured Winogradskyella sp.]